MKTKLILCACLIAVPLFAATVTYKLSTGEVTGGSPTGHKLDAGAGEGTLTVSDGDYATLLATNQWPAPFIVSNGVFRAATVNEQQAIRDTSDFAKPLTLPGGVVSSGRIVAESVDVETTDPNRGLILTAENGTRWLLSVTTNGQSFATQIAASPEITFGQRQQRLAAKRQRLNAVVDELDLTAAQKQQVWNYMTNNVFSLYSGTQITANIRTNEFVERALIRALFKATFDEQLNPAP